MQKVALLGSLRDQTNGTGLLAILGVVALIPILAVGVYFPPHYELFEHTAFRALLILGLELAFSVLALSAVGGVSAISKVLATTNWGLIGVLVALAFSMAFFFPENSVTTVLRTVFWLGHLAFGLTLYALLGQLNSKVVFVLIAAPIVTLVLLYTLFLLIYYLYAGSPSGDTCAFVTPGLGNIRTPGYFTSAGLGILIGFVGLLERQRSARLLAFSIASGFSIFIFYTGTRGALFSVAAALFAISFVLPIAKSVRLWATFVSIIIVSAVVTYIIPAADCGSFGIINRIARIDEETDLGSGRLEIMLLTVDLIKQYPWFGRGEFLLWNLPGIEVSQPHNAPLQTLLTWGIFGSLIFWFLLLKLGLKLFLGARHTSPGAQCLVFTILILLAYSNIDGTLYYSLPLLILAMLSAGAAAIILRPEQDTKEHSDPDL